MKKLTAFATLVATVFIVDVVISTLANRVGFIAKLRQGF